MKLRYFVLDQRGMLTRVRRPLLDELWRGRLRGDQLGNSDSKELRLVSVLCDERLLPIRIYLLRLPLTDGQFTRQDYRKLRLFAMPQVVTPREMVRHHTEGWPHDFFCQLAVALDVPRLELDVPIGIGGPLLMAAALRVSPLKAIKFLR